MTTASVRLRYLLRPRDEVGRPDLQVLSVYRDYGVIPKSSRDDNFNKTPVDLSRYQVVRPGDLVVNKMKAWQGSLAVSQHHGIVSPDYLVCAVSSAVHAGYLHFLLRSRPLISQFLLRSKGIRPAQWRLYWDDLADIAVQLPPREEQRHIAGFLGAETARIDELHARRERQRQLLDERHLTAVFEAVVGLDEPAERRDSGIAWLGSVPRSWPVMAVGHQFEVLLGKMLNQERAHGSSLRPYLRNTNVQWDRILTDDLLEMDFPPGEQVRYRVLPGDLMICEGGEPGRAAIWDGAVGEIYYQKALHRARPRGYSSPRWLFYCMRAATALNVFAVEGNTTTIAHLTSEQLRAHRFPFPDRATQDRLVAGLDAGSARQHRLITQLGRQQALLSERRQALIAAAVTGQLDVSTASGRGIED
ncbi:hypothetical protein AB0K00_44980 [Dactylosporangium sp. NPDC049525]|uniref:hypothetical protein n=1 Tax=Dactylosporangium sp. NPDC049525 TaxID=3154730 RepID=UPI00342CC851